MTRRYTDEEVRAAAERVARRTAIGLRPVAPDERPAPLAVALEPELVTPEWHTHWLPPAVALWVEACHQALGVPKVMAIAAAMTAAATVLQGKVEVELRPGWREPLSLYWLVFAATGARKSALLKLAKAPILAMQAVAASEAEPAIRKATNEKARLASQIQRLRRSVKAHSYSEGAQETLSQLREMEHEHDSLVVPTVPRWLYDDLNPTVMPRKLRHNEQAEGIARIAVMDAEGTFLANALGRHSGHINVDLLLKGYSGDGVDMVRTVQGQAETLDIHISSAHITLLQLVQPHLLDKLRSESLLGDNGFLGRCLMSHCRDEDSGLPFDAPGVAQEVQDGYGRWLATLAAVEPQTVWQMPSECHALMAQMHAQMDEDRRARKGASGWIVRSLGRICRIVAMTEIGELSKLSNCHGGSGVARTRRVLSNLSYLYNTIYSAGLGGAQLIEPTRTHLPALARRTLRWLRQSKSSPVGGTFTLRELVRGLRVSTAEALSLSETLLESGHVEVVEERKHRNKTTTVTYRVISLDPNGTPETTGGAEPVAADESYPIPGEDELEPETTELPEWEDSDG